ncbi:ABC transporter ATP-binding protein [Gulosibacter faecalis]|uniref:ABC transporter ATP-binding protein n=1 Tax=Gulosibacter faecalis TaxID=272240 RepID=A0ABW5UUW6_9MICO|nr:ABC transporter ATP-binding protein [Gulosibacter faecalis]
MPESRFDPLQLGTYRRQLTPEGSATLTRALWLHILAGVVEGLALLSLLPIATVLAQGGTAWGLSLVGWLVVLAVFAAGTFVLRYFEELKGYSVALDFMRTSHQAIGDRLARLPLGWFGQARTGGLSRLVADGFMSAASVLAHMLGSLVVNASALVTIIVGSWVWDARLGLVFTVAVPVAVAVMAVARAIKRAGDRVVREPEREYANRIVEYAVCQPALRAAGRADGFAPLERAGRDFAAAKVRDLWLSSIGLLLNGIVMQAIVVVLITVAASLAVDGTMGAIETVAFIGLTLRVMRTLEDLASMSIGLESSRTPLLEMREILEAEVLPEAGAAVELPTPGEVDVRGVSFGYDAAAPVLRDVSFTARPGTMTALVGHSGSGKTTIARLISRFWDVDGGSVRVGGVDIREQPTEQLMSQLSMVFQDVYLFDDTLEANVRVGRPDASDVEVHDAARLAGVTQIAERLPDGWQSRVGEGGRSLSGGERQRVAIARALLKRAPIVLFDEATSALDAENEANVLASMQRLRATSTLIVIAHKLATVREADQIVVLGREPGAAGATVVERGTHDELFDAEGQYRHFWNRRAAAAGWSLRGAAGPAK